MDSWSIPVPSAFSFEGIHIHPSHLASPVTSEGSGMSYMEEFDESEREQDWHALEKLNLSTSTSSIDSLDYFSPASSHEDEFSLHDDESESNSSTPTNCSPISQKLKDFSPSPTRASPFLPTYSLTDYSASNSFTSVSPRAQSPSPSVFSPYGRRKSSSMMSSKSSGGTSMLRSVSSPVETQYQLDQRNSRIDQVFNVMDSEVSMVRSKSMVGGGMRIAASSGPIRTGGNSKNRFEAGWGTSLPMRDIIPPALVPFPYNLVANSTNPHMRNISRSHSVSGGSLEHPFPTTRQNSLPFLHIPIPLE